MGKTFSQYDAVTTPNASDLLLMSVGGLLKKITFANLTAGIGGGASPLTTKGDLYGYDTDNARVPVGTNNHVLMADSAQALGIKYSLIGDANTDTFTTTKISTVSKSLLNSAIVYNDQDNTYGTNIQTFTKFRLVEELTPSNPPSSTIEMYAYDRVGRSVVRYITPSGLEVQLAQDGIYVARNNTGVQINKGEVVYIDGQQGNNRPTVALAIATSELTGNADGVAAEDIPNNSDGFIMFSGMMENLDTSAFIAGDTLWVHQSVAGTFQDSKPSVPPYYPKKIATVMNSHATQGRIFISMTGIRGIVEGTNNSLFSIGSTGDALLRELAFTNSAGIMSLQGDPTANRVLTLPDATGTLALTSDLTNFVNKTTANTYTGGGTQNFGGATLDNVGILISNAGIPAGAGAIRLGNNEQINWRDVGNAVDAYFRFGTTDKFEMEIASVTQYSFSATEFSLLGNKIVGVPIIQFNNAAVKITNNSSDMRFDSGSSGQYDWYTGTGATYMMTLHPTGLIMRNSTPIIDVSYLESNAAIPATVGAIRLGNGEGIFFRNSLNSADFSMTFSTSDVLVIHSPAVAFNNQSNPLASLGILRFENNDQIAWRNSANTQNHWINMSTNNRFEIFLNNTEEYYLNDTLMDFKGNAAINVNYFESNAAIPANSGTIRLGNTEALNWRNAANSDNLGIQFNASNNLVFNSTAEIFGANIITNHSTVTPVAGDFALIHDATDGTIKKVDVTAFLGGGASPLTTKGDLFGYDTSDARVPIGTNNQVLIADSAQTLGLKWGNVSTILPSNIVYNNQANTYSGGGTQNFAGATLDNVGILISNAVTVPTTGTIRLGSQEGLTYEHSGTQPHFYYDATKFMWEISNDDSLTFAPYFNLLQSDTTPTSAHTVGGINFQSWSSTSVLRNFAYFQVVSLSNTNTDEDGSLVSYIMIDGSPSQWLVVNDSVNQAITLGLPLIIDAQWTSPTSTVPYIHGDANGMIFNTLTGDDFSFKINAVDEYTFSATQADFLGSNLINVNYQDFDRISAPSDPATDHARLYHKQIDSNNDGLFVKLKKNGSIVEVQIV